MDIENIVVKTLAYVLEKTPADIKALNWNEPLKQYGLDSITFIRFIVEIEKSLAIEVPDNDLDMDKFATLDKMYKILTVYAGNKKNHDNSTRHIIKCIITDCDNCLWSGVAADDGYENLIINGAYVRLQQILTDAYNKGVLLALCSKNDEQTICDAFESRYDMILKPNHIITQRINWREKHDNISDIAGELNIGLDSILYIDDSERELFWINQKLPDVRTVLFNGQNVNEIESIISGLQSSDTAESAERTQLYLQEKKREASKSGYNTIEGYYGSLKTVLTFRNADKANVERLVELSERTNQFNLNMTRYSEEDICSMLTNLNYDIITLTADDIFGTLGLCAFCVVKYDGATAVIEGFMMSCRVFGRYFEDMFLEQIIKSALKKDCRLLTGLYTPTEKNRRFAEFYSMQGFKENGNVFILEMNDGCKHQIPTGYFSEVSWIT